MCSPPKSRVSYGHYPMDLAGPVVQESKRDHLGLFLAHSRQNLTNCTKDLLLAVRRDSSQPDFQSKFVAESYTLYGPESTQPDFPASGLERRHQVDEQLHSVQLGRVLALICTRKEAAIGLNRRFG